MAGTLTLGDGAHDNAHAFRDLEFLHDVAEALTFLGIIHLAGDAELIGVRHEYEIAPCHGDIGGDSRSLVADGALGDLDHDFGSLWVDARDILGGEVLLFLLLFLPLPLNFL